MKFHEFTYGAPSNVEFSDISSVFSAIFDIILSERKRKCGQTKRHISIS